MLSDERWQHTQHPWTKPKLSTKLNRDDKELHQNCFPQYDEE